MRIDWKIEILSFFLTLIAIVGVIVGLEFAFRGTKPPEMMKTAPPPIEVPKIESFNNNDYEKDTTPKGKTITAVVTAYNSVEAQTDSTPCIGAGGYICGVEGVIACPRKYELGTQVLINERPYICLDRLARKYDNRFDIFFDQDIKGAKEWGIKTIEVTIYD